MGVFSNADKIKKILFGDATISKVYFGDTLIFSNSCKVTWKYLSAYPDTWTTVEESVEFGATPSRSLPSEVVSSNGNEKKTATAWDDLSPVTTDRVITCGYNIAYRATGFVGTHCTTTAEAKWYSTTDKITWQATELYWFGSGNLTKETAVTPGQNTCEATAVPSYTLTATNANPEYGDLSISRTASPYARAPLTALLTAAGTATIYQGDTLSGTSIPKPDESGSWGDWETIAAPTVTSTGASETGNITIKNNDSQTCTLFYNTTDSTSGGISAGSVGGGASTKVTSSIQFGGTYYCYAARTIKRIGTGYHHAAASDNYVGTAEVTANVSANFGFTRTEGQAEQYDQGYSATVPHTVAGQEAYTITFRDGSNAKWNSSTSIENVPYGTAITSSITNSTYKGTGSITISGKTRQCETSDGSTPICSNTKYTLSFSGIPSAKKVTNNLTISCNGIAAGTEKTYGTKFTFKVKCGRFENNPNFKDRSLIVECTAAKITGKNFLTVSRKTTFGLNTTATQPSSTMTYVGNMVLSGSQTSVTAYSAFDDFADDTSATSKYAYNIMIADKRDPYFDPNPESRWSVTDGWKLHAVNAAGQQDTVTDTYTVNIYSMRDETIA